MVFKGRHSRSKFYVITTLAYAETICNLLFLPSSQLAVVPLPLYTPVHPSSTTFSPILPMLEIILSNHLHFLFLTCTDVEDPIVSPNLVHFSDPVMDTYCLPTEMAQEHIRLVLSVRILFVEQLMEDPLDHRVSGSTVQSQALSCSPAVCAITCHSGVKKRFQNGHLFSPKRPA